MLIPIALVGFLVLNNSAERFSLGADKHFSINLPQTYQAPLTINDNSGLVFSLTPLEARAATKEELAPNKFRYVDAYQNTDVVQTMHTNKIKEDIILKKPGHPTAFWYKLDKLDQYVIEVDDDGNLIFYDKRKLSEFQDKSTAKVFKILAPFLIDADGYKSHINQVEATLDGSFLTFIPNPAWLSSHPYPIILDPTIEIFTGAESERPVSGTETITHHTWNKNGRTFRKEGTNQMVYKSSIGQENGSAVQGPVIGGAGGGGGGADSTGYDGGAGGAGGGVIYIEADTITINPSTAVITADGNNGSDGQAGGSAGGGGGGGGGLIWIRAKTMTGVNTTTVTANGGAGGSGGTVGRAGSAGAVIIEKVN